MWQQRRNNVTEKLQKNVHINNIYIYNIYTYIAPSPRRPAQRALVKEMNQIT